MAVQPRLVVYMAKTITALRVQKRNTERVNVYLDGEFAFGLPVIVAARLRVGQELSEEDVLALRAVDEAERAYERALDFLSYRPRSEHEVRRALHKYHTPEPIVDEVIERLKRAGLVDDTAFVQYWIENRAQFRPRGLRALRQELRAKGVPEAEIAEGLAGVNEEGLARKATETALRRFAHLPLPEFRRKLEEYLVRRGFSFSVVEALVDEIMMTKRMQSKFDRESEG